MKRGQDHPYLGDWRQRYEIDTAQSNLELWQQPQGSGIGAFPACATSVPLKLVWDAGETHMMLVGGLLGVSQSPDDRAVSPECGWVVAYAEPVDANEALDLDGLSFDPITGETFA